MKDSPAETRRGKSFMRLEDKCDLLIISHHNNFLIASLRSPRLCARSFCSPFPSEACQTLPWGQDWSAFKLLENQEILIPCHQEIGFRG